MLNGSWKKTNGSMYGKVIGDVLPQTSVWLVLHSIISVTNLFMYVNEEPLKYTGVYNFYNNSNNNNNILPQDDIVFRCISKIMWICINVKCAYYMYWSLEEFNELFCFLIVTVRFRAATRTLCDLYWRTQFSLIHCYHLHTFSLFSVPGYKFILFLTVIFLGLAFQDSPQPALF